MLRTVDGALLMIAVSALIACGNEAKDATTAQRDGGSGGETSKRDASGATDTDAGPGRGELAFTAVAEEAPPADAKLIVVWTVADANDYAYAFGSGGTEGTQVSVSFSAKPPAAALHGGKLGVGLLALVDPRDVPPEGKLADGQFDPTRLLAFAPDYAVVFRGTTETLSAKEWDAAFPQGYACGRCKRAASESERDTFELTDCSNVKVALYSKNLSYCNWN